MEVRGFLTTSIKTVLWIIPVVALVVADSMFFPFITAKNFLFRFLVELALCLYIALAWQDRSFRPRLRPLLIAFGIFTFIVLIADIFSLNPARAFWSNFERMEGFVMIAHLFAYVLVLVSVFREKKDWYIWLSSTLGVSIFLLFFAGLQLVGEIAIQQGGGRVDGRIGNAAYFAGYLLFHIFFTVFLFLSRGPLYKGIAWSVLSGSLLYFFYYIVHISPIDVSSTGSGLLILLGSAIFIGLSWWRLLLPDSKKAAILGSVFYGSIFLGCVMTLYYTATRGAILGFIGGVFLSALYIAWKEREKPWLRKLAIGLIALVVLLVGGFVAFRNGSFIQGNPILKRFADIRPSDIKTEARGYTWDMALQGFYEKPLLGWGQEGFIYIFTKHYHPALADKEPWFDRAHNIYLDWLVAAGVLGLLGYLSLYGAALYSLLRSSVFAPSEKAVLLGLLGAYAFQNIFIFDNLLSYLLFGSVIAFASLSPEENQTEKQKQKNVASRNPLVPIAVSAAIFIFLAVSINTKPLAQNRTILQALSPQPGGLPDNLSLFKKVVAYGSFGTSEGREQLLRTTFDLLGSPEVPEESKRAFAELTLQELRAQTEETPHDARAFIALGTYLGAVGSHDEAILALSKARTLSPRKQPILFLLASSYLAKGDRETAITLAREAYDSAPQVDQVKGPYARILLLAGQTKEAVAILSTLVNPSAFVDQRTVEAMVKAGLGPEAILLLEKTVMLEPTNSNAYVVLANTYAFTGQVPKAIETLEKMKKAFPEHAAGIDGEIARLKAR